jgi:Ca-activated chloride channel family protein
MLESLSSFHFAQPSWLWVLCVPLLVGLWLHLTTRRAKNPRIGEYADSHLLPYLISSQANGVGTKWRRFARWTVLWSLMALAMAGPQWGFTDVDMFRPANSVMVLLDISRSMEVADVKPSRFGRARQEIEDTLKLGQGLRMGMIAFASVPHVISPVTEDTEGLRRLLPALSTDLGRLQGSRAMFALDQAEHMLVGQPDGGSRAILLITDGDLIEPGLEQRVKALAAAGIELHVLAVGTETGGAVPARNGGWVVDASGQRAHSRLNEPLLQALATAGKGTYQRADYKDGDVRTILDRVQTGGSVRAAAGKGIRIWHERFYWVAAMALLLLLPWFRKWGSIGVHQRERLQ